MATFFVPVSDLLHATFEFFLFFKKMAVMFQAACGLYKTGLSTLAFGPQSNSRVPNDRSFDAPSGTHTNTTALRLFQRLICAGIITLYAEDVSKL